MRLFGITLGDRIPPLRGRAMALYGIVWSAALAWALVLTGLCAWIGFTIGMSGLTRLGLVRYTAETPVIGWISSDEARASGLRRGDVILAVDGVPMRRLAGDVVVRRSEGASVIVTVRDTRSHVVAHRLTWRAAHWAPVESQRRWSAAWGLFCQLTAIVAAIALFGRRREPVPAMMALGNLLLAGGNYGASSWEWLGLNDHIALLSAPGMALTTLGLLYFPDGRVGSPAGWLIGAAVVGWSLLFAVTGNTGASWTIYLALLVAVLIQLGRRYRGMAGAARQQVRWAVLGIACWGAGLAILLLYYIGLLERSDFPPAGYAIVAFGAGMLGAACATGGLLVSLLHYRLYDADVVISRSAALGVLTIGFLALFAGSEKLIEILGEEYFGESLGMMAGGLGAAVAAVLMVPLHHRVSHWAEHRFQKALIRLRHGLPLLVGDLRETASAAAIARAVADAVAAGVRATCVAVLLDGDVAAVRGASEEAARDGAAAHLGAAGAAAADALFPIVLPLAAETTEQVGWLLVGRRPDGSLPGKEERAALREIAGPVARAIAIAHARERADERVERRIAALERHIFTRDDGAMSGPPPSDRSSHFQR